MPTGSDPQLKTAARRRVVAHWRQLAIPQCQHPQCRWPDHPIWYGPRLPGRCQHPKGTPCLHRLALDVDEIIGRHLDGRADTIDNTRPTHAGCNRSAGTRVTNALLGRVRPQPVTSRRWW